MRLAYICTDRNLAVFGTTGRAAYIRGMLKAILATGARVDLFAARLDGDKPDELQSIAVHKLSAFAADLAQEDSAMLRANRELRRLLDTSRGGVFSAIVERYSPWCYAGMEFARSRKIAGILEVTDSGIAELQTLTPEMQKISNGILETAGVLRPGSAEVQSYLESRSLSFETPSILDPEQYSTGTRLTIRKTGAFTIGYLGDLHSAETIQHVVEAFTVLHHKYPESRLVVVGEGNGKAHMITELSRRGLLGTACFLGKLPGRRIPGVLTALDVCVFCDKPEAAAVRNCMLGGVPIVASPTQNMVRDKINGLVYEAGNARTLFSSLECLYKDRILRLRLGSNARRSIMTDGIWEQIAAGILRHVTPPPAGSLATTAYATAVAPPAL